MLDSAVSGFRAIIPSMAKARFRKTQIRAWRKEKGLTLVQLAGRLEGVEGGTASNLSKIERGEQPYTQPLLEAISDALDVPEGDLLDRKPGTHTVPKSELDDLPPDAKAEALRYINYLKTKAA